MVVLVLYKKEVHDFYYNLQLNNDDCLDTIVNGHQNHLNEKILGMILQVST